MKCIDFATAKFLDTTKRTCELFGLSSTAKAMTPNPDNTRTTRVTFNGTRHYVAPEVLENRGSGKAVDLWALGITFFSPQNFSPTSKETLSI